MCSTSWIVPVRLFAAMASARAIAGGKAVSAAVEPAAVATVRRKWRRSKVMAWRSSVEGGRRRLSRGGGGGR